MLWRASVAVGRYAGGAQPITRAASDGSVRDVHWGIGQIGVTLTKCRRIASPALQHVQRACLGGVRVFSRELPCRNMLDRAGPSSRVEKANLI